MVAAFRRTRFRLTLAAAGIFAVVAVGGAIALWVAVSRVQLGGVDASLHSQGQTVIAALNNENGQVYLGGADPLPQETASGIAVGLVLVDNGQVSASAGAAVPPQQAQLLAAAASRSGDAVFATVPVGAAAQRTLALPVPGSRAVLVLSRPLAETDDTLRRLAVGLAAIVVLLVAAVAVLAHRLAGRALRPVEEMSRLAQHISERDLHRRLELDLPDDELGRLARTLNGMLARLEDSFGALRRFTADAAHELRAPLTLMHTELEMALHDLPHTPVEEATLRNLLGETQRLSRLADQLLLLARADAGALALHPAAIDVGDLVEETVDRWRRAAERQEVEVKAVAPDAGTLCGDPDLLRRLLDNLMANALRHTPAEGWVGVSAERESSGWLLAVADSGPGVPAALRPRLFDRFSRGDTSRGNDSGGAGLGLALCAAIAEAHGGSIELDTSVETGARFVVRLPPTPPEGPPQRSPGGR